jgi:hypothetical protein
LGLLQLRFLSFYDAADEDVYDEKSKFYLFSRRSEACGAMRGGTIA